MEFVVGASEATMKSLLGKLGGLLAQEYTLIRSVRSDVQYINDELATMQAFLGDIGSAPDGHDRRLKDWMKQIRDMGYDMEDCIDDFAHRLPHDSLSDVKCSFIVTRIHELWTFWPRRQIASRIGELKVRAQHIAERRSRYGVDNPKQGQGSNTDRSTSGPGSIAEHLITSRQLIHTEEPVGIDMQKLRDWLQKHNESEKHRSVLSLVGFGGVGKTTIASALYREFRNQFDCRASVTVSQNYDEDQVLRDIIGQIKPQDSKGEQQPISLENRHLVANIADSVKKLVMPLICGQKQQGNNGTSGGTQSKIEAMVSDQLIKESQGRLNGKRQQSSGGTQTKTETTTRDQLITQLKGRLNGKRYLILIDDIWSSETWDNIRHWLPHDNTENSRVIVTTRFQAVGAACSERDGTDLLHAVDVLNDDNSEKLFHRSSKTSEQVSTTSQTPDPVSSKGKTTDHEDTAKSDSVTESQGSVGNKKEEVHKEMWEYCGGLPLALVTMAGLFGCNPNKTKDHWGKVCKSLFPEQVAPLTLEGLTRILDYCYNDLPADLKTCTLYLSIFPKGSKIYRKRLTRRWISECFVTEKQGLTAEEVAETYFNQLISRKIIHAVEHNSNGKIKSFKVHDMILEYIVSKSSEENFITVVGGHWLMPAPSNKVRRLSMQSSGSKHENSTKGMNLSQVRSLTVFGSQNRRLPFHSFNNGIIQVLDLEGWKSLEHKHLKDICKMVALKYLSLRQTEVSEIPSEIGKLEYLETLDIRETKVVVLPKSFGKLKRLRHMLGGSKNPHKALKLPQEKNKEPMKALRIVSGIEITEDSAAVASLHQLTGLKKLAIYKLNVKEGGETSKLLRSSIEYLCSCGLQTLAINDEGSDFINSLDSMTAPPRYLIGLELSGKMEKPPKWIKELSNLYKLTLSVTVLQTKTFQLIQGLPKLFSLTFTLSAPKDDRDIVDILEENKQITDREIIVPPGGFESLKLLRFFATLVPRLSFAVKKEEKVMSALERIDMSFQAFEGIYGIETLESLQEVYLSVDTQADDITKFLVDELKDAHKHSDKECAYKWPKIITS